MWHFVKILNSSIVVEMAKILKCLFNHFYLEITPTFNSQYVNMVYLNKDFI